MIFLSKIIRDPAHTWPNKLGNTVGLVFYTPKYWDCREYDFYANQFDSMRPKPISLGEEEMERRFQAKRAHRHCKRKHLSYPGYMYWVGPKYRYELNYMGRNKIFRRFKHGRYTRLLDNGEQNPPRPEMNQKHREFLDDDNKRFNRDLADARQQMMEYERVRGGA